MTFKYPSPVFQYSSRVRCKNKIISIYGTILLKIFNRKLGLPVRKEQKNEDNISVSSVEMKQKNEDSISVS